MENKKTKKDYFEILHDIVADYVEDEALYEELTTFVNNEIELLEKRKASAAKRAEKKKQESDALTDKIFEILGDTLVTVDEILGEIDEGEVTRNKVTARLGKLIKAGKVEKEAVKVDGHKRMAYRVVDTKDGTVTIDEVSE